MDEQWPTCHVVLLLALSLASKPMACNKVLSLGGEGTCWTGSKKDQATEARVYEQKEPLSELGLQTRCAEMPFSELSGLRAAQI